ncbi:anti-sigma factor domain-containing protein [Streptomyces sp. NPDC008121]|uniref:anti-sigma factor n=1 Tax=Streptomyces sp. NPDC008121 TaxID=3364809 RepID=UPI0036E734C4
MNAADLHTMTGAYVLDALDTDEEREAVERHLAHCASCAHEVRELSETAARLGLAVAEPVGPELRADVLRRITTVRQFPPATEPSARTAWALRGLRRLPGWALAASLVGAVALGGVAALQYERAEDARRAAHQARAETAGVAAVLAAPDARVTTARLRGGAVGTVVYAPSANRAVFAAADLPEPPDGKVYQLWFDDRGVMRPAGLLPSGSAASATLLTGVVDRATAVGLTLEPAGGSPRPTSAPVAVLALPMA